MPEFVKQFENEHQLAQAWDLNVRYPEHKMEPILKYCQTLCDKHIVIESNGIKVKLDQYVHPYMAYLLINQKYEHGDIQLISEYINNTDRVMLIGGGLGVTSVAAAWASGSSVKTIEANKELLPKIQETAMLNYVEVQTIEGFISAERDQHIEFAVSNQLWASSAYKQFDTAKIIRCQSITIEDVLSNQNVLIIDIEGGETEMFKAAIPEQINKIIVEVHVPNIGHKQVANVFNLLYQQKFQLIDYEGITYVWQR